MKRKTFGSSSRYYILCNALFLSLVNHSLCPLITVSNCVKLTCLRFLCHTNMLLYIARKALFNNNIRWFNKIDILLSITFKQFHINPYHRRSTYHVQKSFCTLCHTIDLYAKGYLSNLLQEKHFQ